MNVSRDERPQWLRILTFLYQQLGEEDSCNAVRRRYATCKDTEVRQAEAGVAVRITQHVLSNSIQQHMTSRGSRRIIFPP